MSRDREVEKIMKILCSCSEETSTITGAFPEDLRHYSRYLANRLVNSNIRSSEGFEIDRILHEGKDMIGIKSINYKEEI